MLRYTLEKNRQAVIDRFVELVKATHRAEPPAGARRSEILDHLPAFLDCVIAALGSEQKRPEVAADAQNAGALHGHHRLRTGFRLDGIVLEYALFQRAIIEVAEESGAPITAHELEQVAHLTILAVGAAVTQYTRERNSATIREREHMLAMVSHDLRSPLTSIKLLAHRMSIAPNKSRPMDADEIELVSKTVLKSVERMEHLIHDLLTLSRMESGGFKLNFATHRAATILREALDLSRPAATAKNVALSIDGDDCELSLDRDRILQALTNIIGNAVKFSHEGSPVRTSIAVHRDECVFFVVDHGPGLSRDEVEHVGERFWRSTHTHEKGVGLGVSITRAIVQAHNGRMWIESEPGVGTTVYVALPLTHG